EQLRRQLAEQLGGPEISGDLAVSMDNLGRLAEHTGDLAAAQAAFAESLTTRRRLRELLGTPDSLRDLAISLDNVGRVAEAGADWPAAERAYAEVAQLLDVVASTAHSPAAEQEAADAARELAEFRARRPGGDVEVSGAVGPEPPAG
ncbi:MAG TPA: hypothetical protein VFU36_07620, partial [Jatrophihabitans sp.]|nr:hypothetical protein [Jatrophihabitans sp.]